MILVSDASTQLGCLDINLSKEKNCFGICTAWARTQALCTPQPSENEINKAIGARYTRRFWLKWDYILRQVSFCEFHFCATAALKQRALLFQKANLKAGSLLSYFPQNGKAEPEFKIKLSPWEQYVDLNALESPISAYKHCAFLEKGSNGRRFRLARGRHLFISRTLSLLPFNLP